MEGVIGVFDGFGGLNCHHRLTCPFAREQRGGLGGAHTNCTCCERGGPSLFRRNKKC